MRVLDAIVLGVVEGVTEFLPISSTGHLIITNHLLGLEADTPLKGHDGQPLWHKRPSAKNPAGEPLTLKLAADTYTVVIQVGAILAVVLLYRAQLLSMLRGLSGRDSNGMRLLRNLICAFIPVVFIGLAASRFIEQHLFSIGSVIIGLVGGAVLMIAVERWRWRRAGVGHMSKDASDLYPSEALKIGLFQCLALWPGTSRSMVTIVGGYLAGLNPAKAAEFSFLLGLPVLGGAALLKGWRSGGAMIEVFGWSNVLLGVAVAAVSAALAVRFFVAFLTRHGLMAFAVYRLVLAAVIAGIFYL
ncbi:MAG: undecaprenyl-diphosphate phosphatase [Opitutaceae bacterium]|nr:undecaprenyl-diphosphate phosphatase [Opitutaceae bacterium]